MGSDFKKLFNARRDEPKDKNTPTDTPPAKRKETKGKRSDSNYTQVSAYIPKDLHKRVKIELLDGDRNFSDLVTELLANWLDE